MEEDIQTTVDAEPIPDEESDLLAGDAPVQPNCDQGRYRLPPPKPQSGEHLWRPRFGQ
jgi:hypothetical protein